MAELSARDIAELDQMHAAGMADLDALLVEVRQRVDHDGPVIAAAALTARLAETGLDPIYIASWAGLAIVRIVQMERSDG